MIHPDLEMKVISYLELKDVGPCKFGIYPDEVKDGIKPHFHIVGIENELDAAFEIEEAKYYHLDKTDHLTNEQLKQMDDFLSQKEQRPEVIHVGKL